MHVFKKKINIYKNKLFIYDHVNAPARQPLFINAHARQPLFISPTDIFHLKEYELILH